VPNSTVDNPLFFDTECEELPFPWVRTDPAPQRAAEALAAAKALPAGTFGPFSYLTAYQESSALDCAYWPFASAAPEPAITTLPDVPTLIISGADDLRTPTSNARKVAALIPDATVVVVPQTGHSVLTTESGSCAQNAVNAFLGGTTIDTRCAPRAQPIYLDPAPVAPGSLAALHPLHGIGGIAGQTARGLELSLAWTSRELSASLYETLIGNYNPSYRFGLGGLYGGYAKLSTNLTNERETITGSVENGVGTLTIAGKRAAAGTLVATSPNDFVGRLGGVRVHFRISSARLSALIASAAR
jgi:hypothetical protein